MLLFVPKLDEVAARHHFESGWPQFYCKFPLTHEPLCGCVSSRCLAVVGLQQCSVGGGKPVCVCNALQARSPPR